MFTRATQCMRGVLDPPVSAFSLSLYRHPFQYTLFSSRFTLIINNKYPNNFLQLQEFSLRRHTHPGGQFTFHRAAFLTPLQIKVGLGLPKAAVLRININLDGAPIASKSHTHPSHSETFRLLTSSLSLGVPVPRPTQCVRDA
jgi:hypothetical protein